MLPVGVVPSKYNFTCTIDGKHYLYNSGNDALIEVKENAWQIIASYSDNLPELEQKYSAFFSALLQNGFLVSPEMDEYNSQKNKYIRQSEREDIYFLTINPTMDCNFHCWYCYENHISQSIMSKEVFDSICKLIDNILRDEKIRQLSISFFGGEPLLYFDQVLMPLIEHASTSAGEFGKNVRFLITSNGYLLNDARISRLAGYPISDIQIPFDGNRKLHDLAKKSTDLRSSFEITASNVDSALKAGLPITVRCNYTKENIDSFLDFLDIFADAPRDRLTFSFHKIWQVEDDENLRKRFEHVSSIFSNAGFHVDGNDCSKEMCYADYVNSAVINYDGGVYKCTARKFDDKNKLGVLEDSGRIIWNEKAYKHFGSKYHSIVCQDCLLFPICHQGCSQSALEQADKNICPFSYTAVDIEHLLKRRIKFILNNMIV